MNICYCLVVKSKQISNLFQKHGFNYYMEEVFPLIFGGTTKALDDPQKKDLDPDPDPNL